MNISVNRNKLDLALAGLNDIFRDKILDSYIELKKRYAKSFFSDEYDSVGLSSGKFCETVFRFLEFETYSTYTPFDKHIPNLAGEVAKLAQTQSNLANESIRILIPRALLLVYTLRNKRGIGHVGGDIQANLIDIGTIVKISDWIICELIRIYHKLPLSEAQSIIDSLNIKLLPDIWVVSNKKRILRDGLTFRDKTLLLLYDEIDNKASLKELYEWIEYSSLSMYKSRVISPLHKSKMIEFDEKTLIVVISPKGIIEAEKILEV